MCACLMDILSNYSVSLSQISHLFFDDCVCILKLKIMLSFNNQHIQVNISKYHCPCHKTNIYYWHAGRTTFTISMISNVRVQASNCIAPPTIDSTIGNEYVNHIRSKRYVCIQLFKNGTSCVCVCVLKHFEAQ